MELTFPYKGFVGAKIGEELSRISRVFELLRIPLTPSHKRVKLGLPLSVLSISHKTRIPTWLARTKSSKHSFCRGNYNPLGGGKSARFGENASKFSIAAEKAKNPESREQKG